jgi:hypothetical protein
LLRGSIWTWLPLEAAPLIEELSRVWKWEESRRKVLEIHSKAGAGEQSPEKLKGKKIMRHFRM